MKYFRQLLCLFRGHKEEVFRRASDQRQLLWICARCDKVTRSLKLTATADRKMRELRRKTRTRDQIR